MALDGEWRNAMLENEAKGVEYGTAPLPVADDKPDLYGSGFTAGTVIGVPKGAKNPQAAWELVKFLTTDTDALVTLPTAAQRADHQGVAGVAATWRRTRTSRPSSTSSPTRRSSTMPGQRQQRLQPGLAAGVPRRRSGSVKDLDAGLAEVDKRIDDKLKLSGG